jgi:phage baseplate assembly protein gpV
MIGLAAITGIPNEVLRRTWHLPFLDQPQQLFLADGAHYSTSSFIQAVYYNIQKPPRHSTQQVYSLFEAGVFTVNQVTSLNRQI